MEQERQSELPDHIEPEQVFDEYQYQSLTDWRTCFDCLQDSCVCPWLSDVNHSATSYNITNELSPAPADRLRQCLETTPSGSPEKILRRDVPAEAAASAKEPVRQRKRKTRTSPEPSQSARPKFKRTRITDSKKEILEHYFQRVPYPKDEVLARICEETQLLQRTVKTWFANTRVRRESAEQNVVASIEGPDLLWERPPEESTRTSVSEDNLSALEQLSPGSKRASLERYLNASMEDEVAASTALFSFPPLDLDKLQDLQLPDLQFSDFQLPDTQQFDDLVSQMLEKNERSGQWTDYLPQNTEKMEYGTNWTLPADSRSMSSVGSGSASSFRSVDFRGSRRGRSTWDSPFKTEDRPSSPTAVRGRYPCTSPGCTAAFQHRYGWTRHEEAKHHVPFRWVCCSVQEESNKLPDCFLCKKGNRPSNHSATIHFDPCISKTEADRTFYRKDQLAQHIKRMHCGDYDEAVPEAVLEACRSPNPKFNPRSLVCSFCSVTLSSWDERQDHVFSHLEDNDKSPPLRLALGSSRVRKVCRACVHCRKRKIRCDGAKPDCSNCVLFKKSCTYNIPARGRLAKPFEDSSSSSAVGDCAPTGHEPDMKWSQSPEWLTEGYGSLRSLLLPRALIPAEQFMAALKASRASGVGEAVSGRAGASPAESSDG